MKRKGELRVQVDRWPLTDAGVSEHVLTVIVVAAFPGKPDVKTIQQQLRDAIAILDKG